MAEQYNWDLQTQGTVLSSFYVGYLLMQVMGGFLADRFGGKIVLGMGVLLWSFFTIVTPWAALSGMLGLLVARVCMGLGEAVTFPSVYSLVSRWFPSNETAKAVALNASGIPIGTVFALLLTPIIVEPLMGMGFLPIWIARGRLVYSMDFNRNNKPRRSSKNKY
tara:strand:+ start:1412 stop:1903 length:492 start_codon:yes stop_codon:yes gene_type:complete